MTSHKTRELRSPKAATTQASTPWARYLWPSEERTSTTQAHFAGERSTAPPRKASLKKASAAGDQRSDFPSDFRTPARASGEGAEAKRHRTCKPPPLMARDTATTVASRSTWEVVLGRPPRASAGRNWERTSNAAAAVEKGRAAAAAAHRGRRRTANIRGGWSSSPSGVLLWWRRRRWAAHSFSRRSEEVGGFKGRSQGKRDLKTSEGFLGAG